MQCSATNILWQTAASIFFCKNTFWSNYINIGLQNEYIQKHEKTTLVLSANLQWSFGNFMTWEYTFIGQLQGNLKQHSIVVFKPKLCGHTIILTGHKYLHLMRDGSTESCKLSQRCCLLLSSSRFKQNCPS